jgi:hypothetical protein
MSYTNGFQMKKLLTVLFSLTILSGCARTDSFVLLKLYGARDGTMITTNGTPCKKNCGDAYEWKDGKRVKAK